MEHNFSAASFSSVSSTIPICSDHSHSIASCRLMSFLTSVAPDATPMHEASAVAVAVDIMCGHSFGQLNTNVNKFKGERHERI